MFVVRSFTRDLAAAAAEAASLSVCPSVIVELFYGFRCQPTEALLSDMLLRLLGTLF